MPFPSSATALLLLLFSLASAASFVESSDAGLLAFRRSLADAANAPLGQPPIENSSFVLAAHRTHRRNPLDGFKRYTGGWNISETNYWASVGFSAAPFFIIAAVWFVGFGLALLLMCCYYCCCARRSYSYSRTAYACSLVLLILFTIAAIIGCIFLYNGQGKFNDSTGSTLNHVVGIADLTVENLRNYSDHLSDAKKVRVRQFFLSSEDQNKIDEIEKKLNTSANELSSRANTNSRRIRNVFDIVRKLLIVIAAVMLLLTFLGFLVSIFGLQAIVYVFVIIGWILIAATFIVSGVFLLLHNVVSDTCVAMDDWVQNPHAHTALDDILPCVDVATANESLSQSKQVTYKLVNGINQVITSLSNQNVPPGTPLLYYNQSGPLAPTLCNPFASDMSDRNCTTGEVRFNNASQVWRNYVCEVSNSGGTEICTSVGRFTPDIYNQLTAGTSVAFGVFHYTPFLTQLQDCTFVRDTFLNISNEDCPGLSKYSRWVYVGLATVSAAVMLSLLLWVIYARERRHRKYNKQSMMSSQVPVQEKTP